MPGILRGVGLKSRGEGKMVEKEHTKDRTRRCSKHSRSGKGRAHLFLVLCTKYVPQRPIQRLSGQRDDDWFESPHACLAGPLIDDTQ